MTNSEYKHLVCVKCMTYNHASYIEDAMNGFTMQQTDFPFVCIIVDDASTDGELEVIQRYLVLHFDLDDVTITRNEETDDFRFTYARHKTNHNCFFAVYLLKYNHYRKKSKDSYFKWWTDNVMYFASCEGDDYWTDPLKLQTQVDFLEEHEEYSLCCHRYRIYNQNSDTWENDYAIRLFESHPEGFSFTRSDNLRTWITKTMTLMYRKDRYHLEDIPKYKYRCDEHLNYHLLSNGPGYCFPFIGAVYRRNNSGVFSTLSEKDKTRRYFLIRSELLKFNLKDVDLRDILFQKVRKRLFSQGIDKTVLYAAKVCVQSFYRTAGIKSALVSIKKIVAAYIKGMNNRSVASVE